MYYSDVHILYYVFFSVIAVLLGQFIDYASKAFIEEKKIFKKETFRKYRKELVPNYWLIVIMIVSYIALIYKFGMYADFLKNIDLIKYMLLVPMLLCAFMVDLKKQIIPNRLNLLMFEIGLVMMFLSGLVNINIAINMLLGMIAGGGIFIAITLIGGMIAGREAMGLRRCQANGSLADFILD